MSKPKPVNYQLITPDSFAGQKLYPMLNELIEQHHEDLTNARIALAWNLSWKPDVDGRVTLGKCKRATDLDRELAAYDFVIILRQEFMEDGAVEDWQRLALLDHELSHAAVKLDPKTDEPVEDERGRTVYRMVKHDIEEFSSVVARHGIYKRDLEHFAMALQQSKAKQRPLPLDGSEAERLAEDPSIRSAIANVAPRPGSGIDKVTITTKIDGKEKSVTLTQEDGARLREQAKHLRARPKGPLGRKRREARA
jgi:hypothetical protein